MDKVEIAYNDVINSGYDGVSVQDIVDLMAERYTLNEQEKTDLNDVLQDIVLDAMYS